MAVALGPLNRLTLIESALQSERLAKAVLLCVVPAACWTWIVVLARDMYGPMDGASRWMMTTSWDLPHLLLLWVMWSVMMTGMMIPSASPVILTFGGVVRRRRDAGPGVRVYLLAAGYVATWAGFSLLATGLQRLLAGLQVLSPMMEVSNPAASATLLLVAGAYQLTPLKRACLAECQSPLGFFMRHWREGALGAFRMGVRHGLHCLACCWALMLLLFAGGVMNLAVIGGLTAFVALEKLGLFATHGSIVSGVVLLVLSAWLWLAG